MPARSRQVPPGLATVDVVDDQLVLARHGTVAPLTAAAGGHYSMGGMPVAFLPHGAAPTEYLIVCGEPYRRTTVAPSFTPDPTTWERYAGLYEEFPDDPYPIRIRVAGEQLLLHWWGDEVACTPMSDTRFVSERGLIDFEVPPDGGAPVLIVRRGSRLRRAPVLT